MTEENRIPRFLYPSLEDLAGLKSDKVTDETLEKIRAVLCDEIDPREASPAAAQWYDRCYNKPKKHGHEMKLCAVDDLLGNHGTESIEAEGDGYYNDEGVHMCPAFTYSNTGDTYAATLLRDHVESEWLVASWGDALDEYEQENELGSYSKDTEDEGEDEDDPEEEETSED